MPLLIIVPSIVPGRRGPVHMRQVLRCVRVSARLWNAVRRALMPRRISEVGHRTEIYPKKLSHKTVPTDITVPGD